MRRDEAREVLAEHLENYRLQKYQDLVSQIGRIETVQIVASSGRWYAVEVQVLWDAGPHGDIRVVGNIDDGGLRAMFPLNESLLVAP
jgi:hypothetical protein